MLIVQKFGGSSVADATKIARAADIAAEACRSGRRVVTVVSAQGDETDALIRKAHEISPHPGGRELDALLSTGEQVSAALLAIELEKRGLPAVSLTGWQLGLRTDSNHGAAMIGEIDTARLRRELDAGRLVIAAGFQGVDGSGDITTLGRGGSDTSAVALAAALGADACRIYTDVDGVYTADPRKVAGARKLDAVAYGEMLELSAQGSQVLHDRCVALAMRRGVVIEVLSSAAPGPGTRIGPAPARALTGVTKDGGRVTLVGGGLDTVPDAAPRLTQALSRQGIPVRRLVSGPLRLTAVVPEDMADAAVRAIHQEFFE